MKIDKNYIGGLKVALSIIQYEIDYLMTYRIKPNDYSNGFSGIESGECCDKCRLDYKKPMGNMAALIGCKNPFQIKEQYGEKFCQCHIPFRKVAIASEMDSLENIKRLILEEIKKPTHKIRKLLT